MPTSCEKLRHVIEFERMSNEDGTRLVGVVNKEVGPSGSLGSRRSQGSGTGGLSRMDYGIWLEWRSRAVAAKERCVP
jgi:hypothetical protein